MFKPNLKHLIFLCYITNCKIKQKEETCQSEISQRLEKDGGDLELNGHGYIYSFFLLETLDTLTIITGQLYNLAPLQMRGHPRPSAEVAASGGKFTLGEKSAISRHCPRSHLAGIKWRIGCIIDDTPSLINRMSQHTQPHLGSVTSEVVVCPRGNLHALKISGC